MAQLITQLLNKLSPEQRKFLSDLKKSNPKQYTRTIAQLTMTGLSKANQFVQAYMNQIAPTYNSPDEAIAGVRKKSEEFDRNPLNKVMLALEVLPAGGAVGKNPVVKQAMTKTIKGGKKLVSKYSGKVSQALEDAWSDILGTAKKEVKPVGDKLKVTGKENNFKVDMKESQYQFNRSFPQEASNEEFLNLVAEKPFKATPKNYSEATNEEFLDLIADEPYVAKAINKVVDGTASKTDTERVVQIMQEGREEFSKFAKNLEAEGVKLTKKDGPKVLKFINQLGDIIKNSPDYIKGQFSGTTGIVTTGMLGVSMYDLWTAFKDGGDSLLPKATRGGIMALASMSPGGAVVKLLLGSLGYYSGDKLARACVQKLNRENIQDNTDDDTVYGREINEGYREPGLSEYIASEPGYSEYMTGASGRRYHIVNDKVYAFDTGKPVKIQEASDDISAYNQQQTAKVTEQANNAKAQYDQLVAARERGYNISDEQIQQAATNYQSLQQQVASIPKGGLTFADSYDSTRDLSQQYYEKEVVPAQQVQQVNQLNQQNQINQAYEYIFNDIAQKEYDRVNQYFTPENLAIDYAKHMTEVYAGRSGAVLSPEQYAEIRKQQYMFEAAPQIQQNAIAKLQGLMESTSKQQTADRDYALDVRKQTEVERNNYAKNLIDAYVAEEGKRHNIESESNTRYSNQTGRINANVNAAELPIKQQNADTSRGELAVKQQMLPYNQASKMGEALMNQSMSDVTQDQFLNVNPQVMQQVYPGAFPQQQQGYMQQQLRNRQ